MSAPEWDLTLVHEAVEQAMNTIGAAHAGLPALDWMLWVDGTLRGSARYDVRGYDEQLAAVTPWIQTLDLTPSATSPGVASGERRVMPAIKAPSLIVTALSLIVLPSCCITDIHDMHG